MSAGWALDPEPIDLGWSVAAADGEPIRWRGTLPGLGAALAWLRNLPRPASGRFGLSAHGPVAATLIQAAPLAGIGLVLLPQRLPAAERQHLLQASACGAVLGADLPLPTELDPEVAIEAATPLAPEAIALVLATSGSEDRPKAVALSWRAVLAAAAASATHLGPGPADRWLTCLPLDHAGGAMLVHRSAVSGCRLLLQDGFDLDVVIAGLDACSGISLVPTTLARLVDARDGANWPDDLRCILTGGAPLDPGLRARCAALGRAPCHSYGLSEFGGMVCAQDPAGDEADDSGRPLPGVALRSVDGAIEVDAPSAFSGYLAAGAVTARPTGWIATGDLGSWDGQRLRITGRRGELIISGGENVAPAAVERALAEHPAVAAAGVCGRSDPEWGQRVEAALVLTQALDDADFGQWLRQHLAPHQRPKRWTAVEALPTTPRGKLDRAALARLLADG